MSIIRPTPMQPKPQRYVKSRKALRKMSAEYEKNYRAYLIFRPIFLANHPVCEMLPDCVSPSIEPHHMKGRGRKGSLLCDERFIKATCRTCHYWAHTYPNIARAMGLLLK